MFKVPVSAVCPSYCNELRDIHDFVAEFGPFNGQYVVKFPQHWIAEFTKHLVQLKPVERQAAKALLDKVRLAFVETSLHYDSSEDWVTNALATDIAAKYSHLVGDGLDPTPFKSWVEALPGIRESKVRTWKFKGSLPEYFSAIQPLLQNAPASYLIDRYFDPGSKTNEDLIFYLLDKIKGSRCYELHIVTRPSSFNSGLDGGVISKTDAFSSSGFNNACKKLNDLYKMRVPKSRKLIFHFVKEDRPGGIFLRMHNRFFLTKFGAIDFGQGYDIQNQAIPQMDAYIVDKSHHGTLASTYIDGVCRYSERLAKKAGVAYPIQVQTYLIDSN